MNDELLNKFINSVSTKDSFEFIVVTKESDITVKFDHDINFNPNVNYKIGIVWADGFNGLFNINSSNNQFKYYNQTAWKTITLSIGGYSLVDINDYIKDDMKKKKDYNEKENKYYIELGIEQTVLKTKINLSNNYKVDFSVNKSLRNILGFKAGQLTGNGTHLADTNANIVSNTTLNITCNVVSNFYINGKKTNMLFSHPIKKRPGEYFVIEPKYIVFLPMTTKSFNEINFKLVDLEGNIVSFNGETIKFLVVITQV